MKHFSVTLLLLCSISYLWAYTNQIDGIYYNLDHVSKTAEVTYGEERYSGDVVIPQIIYYNGNGYTVTGIGYQAFASYGWDGLNRLDLPETIEYIEMEAFATMGIGLVLTIPKNVKKIGHNAFGWNRCDTIIYNAKSLKEFGQVWYDAVAKVVIIGDDVDSIPAVFSALGSLEEVVMNENVNYVASGTFNRGRLKYPIYNSKIMVAVPKNYNTAYTITEGTEVICGHAFEECSALPSVSIPNSIKEIGDYAFKDCGHISITTLPSSLEKLGGYAFQNCGSLDSISVPNSVKSFGAHIFDNCLNMITAKWDVRGGKCDYDISPFTNCRNLSTIIFGEHVDSIPNNFCKNFTQLENVVFGSNIKFIDDNAFRGTALTELDLPISLKAINTDAFTYCSKLEKVILPPHLEEIGLRAFYECPKLRDIYVNSIQPPTLSWAVFSSNPDIHLLCEANIQDYEQNYGWGQLQLKHPGPNYTLTLDTDETQGIVQIVRELTCDNDTVVIYAQANTGYHFSSWSDGNTDNPRTIVMTQNKTLHANFAISLYSFTAMTEDATKGRVTANNGLYQYGTELTMTATPVNDYQFDHWQIKKETSFDDNIVVRFSVPDTWQETYAWIWEIGGYGHWETLPQEDGWYVYSTNADNMNILLAKDQFFSSQTEDIPLTESACYIIEDNGGERYPSITKSFDCVSQIVYDNPYSIILRTNTIAKAIFQKRKYYVNLYSANANISCNDSYYGEYYSNRIEQDSTIIVTILPNDGYIFQQWSDGNTENPRTFTITEDLNIDAYCVRDLSVLTLRTSTDESGRVFGAGSFDKYTYTQIFAIPNPGYDFISWSDNSTANPRYIYLDKSEVSLTANFALTSTAEYIVDVTAQNPVQGTTTVQEYVLLEAIPYVGCTFVRWSDGNTDNPRYVELNTDISLQAIFSSPTSGISDISSSPQGTVRKLIINGTLYIIKDGKTYNALGAEIQ